MLQANIADAVRRRHRHSSPWVVCWSFVFAAAVAGGLEVLLVQAFIPSLQPQIPSRASMLAPARRTPCKHATMMPKELSGRSRICCERRKGTAKDETVDTMDIEAREALNDACTKVARVCSAGDESAAVALAAELGHTAVYLVGEGEADAAAFMRQAVRILRHELPAADALSPTFRRALDRLLSTIVGAVWRLGADDMSDADGQRYEEEQANRRGDGGGASGGAGGSTASGGGGGGVVGAKRGPSFYEILGVPMTADQTAVRRAFRTRALETHPDVSDAPDAAERFMRLSRAYEILHEPSQRALYDRYGEAAFEPGSAAAAAAAAAAGGGDGRYTAADDEWSHLQKQAAKARDRKKGKRERARDATATGAANRERDADPEAWQGVGGTAVDFLDLLWCCWSGVPVAWRTGVPVFGDVVTYPLPAADRAPDDDRERGIGLVVGRNIDRGDARLIPDDMLGLCEVTPLELRDCGRWCEDEIAPSAYPHLAHLRVVPVARFDKAGVGEGGGWWTLGHPEGREGEKEEEDWSVYSPAHYAEEVIL
ncbi:unnamed protein product [Phaeothamnion confervicola]